MEREEMKENAVKLWRKYQVVEVIQGGRGCFRKQWHLLPSFSFIIYPNLPQLLLAMYFSYTLFLLEYSYFYRVKKENFTWVYYT